MPDEPRVPGAHEVTLGEVYRLTQRIDRRLDEMNRDMVGREEYESDQESIKNQISALAKRQEDERKNAEAAKRWAITTAIAGALAILTLVGFLLDLGGAPT